jgi:hypothetical protein
MVESTYFNLSREINAQNLINQIQKMVYISNQDDPDSSKILKVSIVKTTKETNELIPKIEYKNEKC